MNFIFVFADIQNTLAFSNVYQNVDICVENNSNAIDFMKKPKLTATKKPFKVKKSAALNDEDVDVDETIHEENPYGDFYVNEEPLIDIDISHLETIIEQKSRNENDGFKKEYAVCSRMNALLNCVYQKLHRLCGYGENLTKMASNCI